MTSSPASDPLAIQLIQIALHAQGLYQGGIDGLWGPKSQAAYEIYGNFNRYAGIATLITTLSPAQASDLAAFIAHWQDPVARDRYRYVAESVDVPEELIAALHWREASGDFGCYLHNGDPMKDRDGNAIPTVNVPAGYLANDWGTAAIDALHRKAAARAASGIEIWTHNLESMCVYAEAFNGLGYRDRGVPSPYVLAGTSGYVSGKYIRDHIYDATAVDQQLGVLVMLRAIVPA